LRCTTSLGEGCVFPRPKIRTPGARTASKTADEGPHDNFRILTCLRRRLELLFVATLPRCETFGLSRSDKLGRGGTDDELGKPLIAIQRVQVPPGQSRADRPVASVAIHRATGGCEACTARKQAVRISSEIFHRCDADAFSPAEGSIRQRPLLRGRAGVAGVPSPGHVSKGIAQEPKRALHLLHTKRNASYIGRYVSPRVDRRGHGGMVEQSYDPIVPTKVGNRRASARSGHGTHWREGGNKQRIC